MNLSRRLSSAAAFAFALVLVSSCSSSTEPEPKEPLTISPDVLSLSVELGQVRNEPFMIVELTNDSEEEISQTEVRFNFWNGSTQLYDTGFVPSGPAPGVTVRDSLPLILLDDLSEFECYTYRFEVSPVASGDQLTEATSKTYPGTCPDDHPSL